MNSGPLAGCLQIAREVGYSVLVRDPRVIGSTRLKIRRLHKGRVGSIPTPGTGTPARSRARIAAARDGGERSAGGQRGEGRDARDTLLSLRVHPRVLVPSVSA